MTLTAVPDDDDQEEPPPARVFLSGAEVEQLHTARMMAWLTEDGDPESGVNDFE